MVQTACLFVWLVLLVSAAKTYYEKPAPAASTKQSKQADRAVRAAKSVSGLPALFCAHH
jgi:hypothetical protein